MRKRTYLLNIFLPLLFGGSIYLLTDPDTFFVYYLLLWFPGLRSGGSPLSIFESIRAMPFLKLFPERFFQLLRWYLPDLLWAYALTFTLFFLLDESAAKLRTTVILSFLFTACMELFQLTPFLTGTFDLWDIIVEWGSVSAAAIIIKKLSKE